MDTFNLPSSLDCTIPMFRKLILYMSLKFDDYGIMLSFYTALADKFKLMNRNSDNKKVL